MEEGGGGCGGTGDRRGLVATPIPPCTDNLADVTRSRGDFKRRAHAGTGEWQRFKRNLRMRRRLDRKRRVLPFANNADKDFHVESAARALDAPYSVVTKITSANVVAVMETSFRVTKSRSSYFEVAHPLNSLAADIIQWRIQDFLRGFVCLLGVRGSAVGFPRGNCGGAPAAYAFLLNLRYVSSSVTQPFWKLERFVLMILCVSILLKNSSSNQRRQACADKQAFDNPTTYSQK